MAERFIMEEFTDGLKFQQLVPQSPRNHHSSANNIHSVSSHSHPHPPPSSPREQIHSHSNEQHSNIEFDIPNHLIYHNNNHNQNQYLYFKPNEFSNKPSRSTANGPVVISIQSDKRVKFNVGGKKFETFVSTLVKYPNTLLGAMFHPRNTNLVKEEKDEFFFDRDPDVFEVILNFYRTGKLIVPDWLPIELLHEEIKYFSLELPEDVAPKRISVELMKLEHKSKMKDASEYRRITRQKLLKDHNIALTKILEKFLKKIEKNSAIGHTSCEVKFLSPLHYTNSTPRPIFNIISKNEIRELIMELFTEKKLYSNSFI